MLLRQRLMPCLILAFIPITANGQAQNETQIPASIEIVAGTKAHEKTYVVNIASQQLDDALIILASQTHTTIAFNQTTNVAVPICEPLMGNYTLEEAIEKLIGPHAYEAISLNSTFIVRPIVEIVERTPDIPPKKAEKSLLEELFIYGNWSQYATPLSQVQSIDNISGGKAIALDISELERVTHHIPGVELNEGSSTTLYIRGVGISDDSDLGDPLVKQYVDGVYTPRLSSFMTQWHDIASIDIEPGPQNNFYSMASVGGRFNINYNKPDPTNTTSELQLVTGSYNTQKVQGIANFPIFNKSAVRLSFANKKRDSIYNNLSNLDTDIPGRIDTKSVRLQYAYNPSDNLNLNVSHSRFYDDGTGNTDTDLTYYLQRARRTTTNTASDIHVPKVTDFNEHQLDNLYFVDVDSVRKTRFNTSSIGGKYSNNNLIFSLNGTANSGKSYNRIGKNRGPEFPSFDYDPSTTAIESSSLLDSYNSDFFQEYDFTTDYKDQRAYSFNSQLSLEGRYITWNSSVHFSKEDLYWFWGDSDDKNQVYFGAQYDTQYKSQTESYYSEISLNLDSNQSFTLGARYSRNKKQRIGIGILTSNDELNLPTHGSPGFEWDLYNREVRLPNEYNDPDELDDQGNPVINNSMQDLQTITVREQWEAYRQGVKSWGSEDTVLDFYQSNGYQGNDFYISTQNGNIDDDAINWRLHYAIDVNDNFRSYFSIKTATSNSGFNDNLSESLYPTYKPEQATSFELGAEGELFDTSFSLNTFLYEYKDKIAILNIAPSERFSTEIGDIQNGNLSASNLDNTNDFRINIPKARSYGFNVKFEREIFSNLSLEANLLYLNAKYIEGEVLDSRMAPFSGFTNADPLRFNDPQTTTLIPDSNGSYYEHQYNIYDYLLEPQFQTYRPGADLNNDGIASHYYQTSCNEGSPNIIGDGRCYTILNGSPDIEYPVRDLAGNKMPRSPSWDIYSALIYLKDSPIGKWNFILAGKYKSAYFLSPFNGEGYETTRFDQDGLTQTDEAPSFYSKVSAHFTMDVSASWTSNGQSPWTLTLIGKNVTNTRYFTNIKNTAWTYSVETNLPRIWEFSIKKAF